MKARGVAFIIGILTVLVCPLKTTAQESEGVSWQGRAKEMMSSPRLSLQLGSSVNAFGSGMHMYSHTLMPTAHFNLGNRFSIMAGSVFSTTHMPGRLSLLPGELAASELSHSFQQNIPALNQQAVFALGAYQLSERLHLVGGGWSSRSHMDNRMINDQAVSMHARGMILGFGYQVNDRFSFGAEVQMSTLSHPHQQMFSPHSPFGGLAAPSSFPYGPFSPGHFRRW